MRKRCLLALSRADDRGGVQVFVEWLAKELGQTYDVALLIGRCGVARIETGGADVLNLGARHDGGILWRLFSPAVQRVVSTADIVITNSTAMSVGVAALARVLRKPVVFIAHGLASNYQRFPVRPFVALIEMITVALANQAVFLNARDRERFAWKRAGVVIANGIPITSDATVKTSGAGIKTVAVMRHTKQKDFPALAAFVRDIMRPEDSLTVVGDGPDYEQNRALLNSQGRQVTFIRQTRAMDAVYASHDVYLLLSKSEGMPLSLLEAMARGLVPIASAIPGVSEVIEHGESGLLTTSNHSSAVGECFELLRNNLVMQRMSLGAMARIREAFTMEVSMTAYRRLVNAVLDEYAA